MNNKSNIILIIATITIILLGISIVIGNKYQRSIAEKTQGFSSSKINFNNLNLLFYRCQET